MQSVWTSYMDNPEFEFQLHTLYVGVYEPII